ncbi:hypothetical protein C8T65DRAFT_828831 [Cerioporus squamosus]|nr:hypothetical protein C8T65DRAFT_828831 [Cerioporus squamosus]
MAALEIEELQTKLNTKNAQKGKTRTLRTNSTCFTSGAGLEAWKVQEAQRQNKAAEKKTRDEARARKAQEQAAVRRDEAFAYTGGLSKQLLRTFKHSIVKDARKRAAARRPQVSPPQSEGGHEEQADSDAPLKTKPRRLRPRKNLRQLRQRVVKIVDRAANPIRSRFPF